MKDSFNKYGRRLTEQEFTQAQAEIYDKKNKREKETNLMIDYHLGVAFPQDKRKLICDARDRAAKRFIFSPATLLKSAFVEAAMKIGVIKRMPDMDDKDIDRASLILAQEFTKEKELETEDIIRFLGEDAAPAVKKLRGLRR